MTKSTRADIRAAFSNAKPDATVVEVFGVEIELRQPTLEAVLDAQAEPDRKFAIAQMIIQYAYVPGTDEPAFDPADKEMLMQIPFGKDMQKINQAIESLTGINMEAQDKAAKNSASPQADSTPLH